MSNPYDPNIHKRRSIRLKGYDYSQPGYYFVTICTKNRECLFGHIEGDAMLMNDAGLVLELAWNDIPNHYPNISLDAFIVMPNHVHGIIVINDNPNRRGKACLALHDDNIPKGMAGHAPTEREFGKPVRSSLSSIIGSFKSAVTKQINQARNTPGISIWQRNYYDHIIRDEISLKKTREYIIGNPLKWDNDDENPDKGET